MMKLVLLPLERVCTCKRQILILKMKSGYQLEKEHLMVLKQADCLLDIIMETITLFLGYP